MKYTFAAAAAAASGALAETASTPSSSGGSTVTSHSYSTPVYTTTGTVTESVCHECPHTSVWSTHYEYPCETGVTTYHTTLTETCNSPHPTWAHTVPNYKPPGWDVSTYTCYKCEDHPVTKTITYPTHNPIQTPEYHPPPSHPSSPEYEHPSLPGGGYHPGSPSAPEHIPSPGGGESSPGYVPSTECVGHECEGAPGSYPKAPSSPGAPSHPGAPSSPEAPSHPGYGPSSPESPSSPEGPASPGGGEAAPVCPGPGCPVSGPSYNPPSNKNATAQVSYKGDSSIVSPWSSVARNIVLIGVVAAGGLML